MEKNLKGTNGCFDKKDGTKDCPPQERDSFFLLLRVNDAAFPIGAFAHSFGLETYVREGLVTDEQSAEKCVLQMLSASVLYGSLLPLRFAWEAAAEKNLQLLEELEELSFAAKTPLELREASRKLGGRFVKTASPLLPDDSFFAVYAGKLQGRCSHAAAFGVFCSSAGINKEDAASAFLYSQASSLATVPVKTIPLSQTAGQRILSACALSFQQLLSKLRGLTKEDLFRSCPGLDLRSMRHEALYSRLYMS